MSQNSFADDLPFRFYPHNMTIPNVPHFSIPYYVCMYVCVYLAADDVSLFLGGCLWLWVCVLSHVYLGEGGYT